MAANNFQAGGVDNNWGTIGNWSLGAVPTANDGNTATFTAASPNCTVNTSARVCNSIDFTNYTNTITMTNQITVSGSVTLGAAMVIAGASALILNATATLTSNGKTWSNALTLQGTTITYTLADNWTVGGTLTFGAAGVITTINGFTINCNGNFTQVGTGQTGTTIIALRGSGNWTVNAGTLSSSLTINASGTYTFVGATLTYNTGTITYTTGSFAGTVPALVITGSSTLSTGTGLVWNNITLATAATTLTLNSILTSIGTISVGATIIFAGTNGFNTTNFTCTTAGTSITFKNGITYTVTSVLTLRGTTASNIVFISASAGNQYNLVLTNNGTSTQSVSFVNVTDANSSTGSTIWNYKGTLSNINNWILLTPRTGLRTGSLMV